MSDSQYNDYIQTIELENRIERGNPFTNEEYAEMFSAQLTEYKKAAVTKQFIKDIAWTFYSEATTQPVFDPELVSILNEFSDVTDEQFDHLVDDALKRLAAL